MKNSIKTLALIIVGLLYLNNSMAKNTHLKLTLTNCSKSEVFVFNEDYGKYNKLVDRTIKVNAGNAVFELNDEFDKPILVNVGFLFEIFLVPGDNLEVKADLTKELGGIRFGFNGIGSKNNRIYQKIRSFYYEIFPTPLNLMFENKLVAAEVVADYNKAVIGIRNLTTRYKDSIDNSLYNYLRYFTTVQLPIDLFYTLSMNNKYDNPKLITAEIPLLDSIEYSVEAFYDMNFAPRINIILEKNFRSNIPRYDTVRFSEKFKMKYEIISSKFTNPIVLEHLLSWICQVCMDDFDSLEQMEPYIVDYEKRFPERIELRKRYNLMVKLKVGNSPPPINLVDINGNPFDLSSLKGKVVYVDFWASWCGPCRGEMKNGVPALHERFKNTDLVFVYISIDEDESAWKKAIQQDKIEGIHLLDKKGEVASSYGIGGVPHYFILDKKGNIYNNNAPRPSNSETANLMLKILKE